MAGPNNYGPPQIDFTPLSKLGESLGQGVRQHREDVWRAQQAHEAQMGAQGQGRQRWPAGEPLYLIGGGETAGPPNPGQNLRPMREAYPERPNGTSNDIESHRARRQSFAGGSSERTDGTPSRPRFQIKQQGLRVEPQVAPEAPPEERTAYFDVVNDAQRLREQTGDITNNNEWGYDRFRDAISSDDSVGRNGAVYRQIMAQIHPEQLFVGNGYEGWTTQPSQDLVDNKTSKIMDLAKTLDNRAVELGGMALGGYVGGALTGGAGAGSGRKVGALAAKSLYEVSGGDDWANSHIDSLQPDIRSGVEKNHYRGLNSARDNEYDARFRRTYKAFQQNPSMRTRQALSSELNRLNLRYGTTFQVADKVNDITSDFQKKYDAETEASPPPRAPRRDDANSLQNSTYGRWQRF